MAPDHALVYVDKQTNKYLAPPCVNDPSELFIMTLGEVHSLHYEPDGDCVDSGAFVTRGRNLPAMLLEEIGVFKPLPSRWNDDGTWNW